MWGALRASAGKEETSGSASDIAVERLPSVWGLQVILRRGHQDGKTNAMATTADVSMKRGVNLPVQPSRRVQLQRYDIMPRIGLGT